MSPEKPKYKLIDAFFSRIRPVAPDSPSRAAEEKEAAGSGAPLVLSTAKTTAGGWPGFSTDIDRGQMGFSFTKGKVDTLEKALLPLPENALRIPLTVSGKTIGSIQAVRKEAEWTAKEIEIISAVAAQLARHLDSLLRFQKQEKYIP